MASFTASFNVRDPEWTGITYNITFSLREKATRYTIDFGTEHLNAKDIERLPSDIFCAHIYDTFHPKAGTYCCGCNTMLACPCFCDDTFLAYPSGQKDLTNGIIDFMRSSVIAGYKVRQVDPSD